MQGKIGTPENFSAELSTQMVDFFFLARRPISLQRNPESEGLPDR
jgi:hypothetical protein